VELRDFMDACRDDRLREMAEEAFTELKGHYEVGDKVGKDLWPRYYRKKWGIDNLYVKKLGRDWRLTYTLVSGAAGIEVFCLEILHHGEYDKRFGYRTS
jgi:hypothetical protein